MRGRRRLAVDASPIAKNADLFRAIRSQVAEAAAGVSVWGGEPRRPPGGSARPRTSCTGRRTGWALPQRLPAHRDGHALPFGGSIEVSVRR